MAYMCQGKKQQLAPAIKAVLKKYGVKGSIAVDNHSSLVVTLKEGVLDFIGDANKHNKERAERRDERFYEVKDSYQVNTYYASEWAVDKKIGKFFKELIDAMNGKGSNLANHDNSDIMTDYFDVGWYVNVNVGKWDKPYKLVKE